MTHIRLVLFVAASATALASPALAAQVSGPNVEVQAAVDAAMSAGLAGDMGKLREQYAPDCVFVDEFAPFFWSGPDALAGYLQSGFRMYQETQHRDGNTTFSPSAFVYVSGDRAFLVEPVSGTSTVRGKPYALQGSYAFTLARIDGRWKITSQTWTKTSETMDPY
jgi:ketosteroid isomerase-like protein